MSWTQGRTLHTTRTGRAKPHGRTTRASQTVKKVKYAKGGKQDRPIGFDAMVHPQALTPTPRHPGCATNKAQYHVHQWADLSVPDICEGLGLEHIPWPELWEVRWPSGENLGYAQPADALSYVRAAALKGVRLNVYQPTV